MDKIEMRFGQRVKELRLEQNFVVVYQRIIFLMLKEEREIFL